MIDAARPLLPAPATGNNEFNWSGLSNALYERQFVILKGKLLTLQSVSP